MSDRLTLGRPHAPPGNSPGALLAFISGALGLFAGITWAVGKDAADATPERMIMSASVVAALGLGWYARRFGVAPAAAVPATTAFCLGIIAWLGLDRPIDAHDGLLLSWLSVLVIASVVLGLLARKSGGEPNVLLELLPAATVENDGVQWVIFAPANPLAIGANHGFVVFLENCHDHDRRTAVALRQVGTALIGGRDRIARVATDVVIPARGFAEVHLPLEVMGDGSPTANVWVSVGAEPRSWRGRVKPRLAAGAQTYQPLLTSVALRIPDPSQLGYRLLIRDDQPPASVTLHASARVIDEPGLRSRLLELV